MALIGICYGLQVPNVTIREIAKQFQVGKKLCQCSTTEVEKDRECEAKATRWWTKTQARNGAFAKARKDGCGEE